VTRVTADREEEDADGTFGDRIAELRPDVVIDLICFTRASAEQLVKALRPSRPLLVHCGTIWGWFGREPVLDLVGWEEFTRRADRAHAEITRDHTTRSIAASIDRAREVLGYAPRYSALDSLREALAWLAANGQADLGGQPFPAVG
jgi:hypothetical protein